jgi:cobalamin biosynthesis protein CbiD
VSILATQRPHYLRLTLADGSTVKLGPYVTGDSAAAAAKSWLLAFYHGDLVVRVEVVEQSP